MKQPITPGEFVKTIIQKTDLSVTSIAKALGVARKTFDAVLHDRSGISPLMAIRLSMAFGVEPEQWLKTQIKYDLWKEHQRAESLNIPRLSFKEQLHHA